MLEAFANRQMCLSSSWSLSRIEPRSCNTETTPRRAKTRSASPYTQKPENVVREILGGFYILERKQALHLGGKALQQLLKEIQQQLVVGASVAVAHTQSSESVHALMFSQVRARHLHEIQTHPLSKRRLLWHLSADKGVSENGGPQNSTLNSRILIIRTPK